MVSWKQLARRTPAVVLYQRFGAGSECHEEEATGGRETSCGSLSTGQEREGGSDVMKKGRGGGGAREREMEKKREKNMEKERERG